MSQAELDFAAPQNRHERDYREWVDENPGVYALYRRWAQDLARQGRRFGIGHLTEKVRWEIRQTWADDRQGFKLNNNYRAYIARDLIREIPELKGLLETRRVRARG